MLELQFILDRLGDDTVRQDLKQGVGGSPLLTDADLTAFDEFYKLVGPDRDQNIRLVEGIDISINLEMQQTSFFFHFRKVSIKLISTLAGWLNSMKKHLCTSGTCWKGRTRVWLEQHVSQT